MKRFLLVSLAFLPLAACSWSGGTTPPIDDDGQTSSVPETKNVIYRGRLLPLGASIYMEGTHRLELEDGRFILLEADGLVLDEYVNVDVEVFGATRPTVEGSGIIMRVERVAEFVESSSSMSSESSSSEESSSSSSSLTPSSSSVAVSSVQAPRSSVAPVVPSSSSAPASSAAPVVSSAASSADAVTLRATAMAKANMDSANWTQQYCSTHMSFCVPVHKNWYYVSFGATSSSQWHVEMSNEDIEALGDGPLTVVLMAGAAPAADGQVTVEGGTAIGYRAWTNNRHFVISAPAVLEAAVRYMTQELKAAPTASSSSASL